MKHPSDTIQSDDKGFPSSRLAAPLECSIEVVGAGSDVVVDNSLDETLRTIVGESEVCKDVGGGGGGGEDPGINWSAGELVGLGEFGGGGEGEDGEAPGIDSEGGELGGAGVLGSGG